MSKIAEEKALEAYPSEMITTLARGNKFRAGPIYRSGFIKGYERAEKDILAIVKEYLEKGSSCMDLSDESQIYAFWDGFHNCAESILRELEGEK